MTTMQQRPTRVGRPDVITLAPPSAPLRRPEPPEPAEPVRARTVAITELMGRRPDLHDFYTPATIAADSILWSA